MSKLVLVDGHAIIHRAFHALPKSLTTKKGELINAVYGFTSMLFKIVENLEPTHLAVCFDRKEPTFRKKEFKDYQAHRPEVDKGLIPQFDKAKKMVRAFNIPVYEKAGFEADDVIGTIAKKTRVDEVVIVTGDRDILQLVDKRIKVYLPIKGLSVAELMDEKKVKQKMGVLPKRVVDYKGLVGDPSDNYKGVLGIGPKTAEKLLEEYGSFKGIYKNIEKIDEKISSKLLEHKDSADMSYKLAKIITDVDIKYDIKDMHNWSLSGKDAEEVFEEFKFKSLAKRAKQLELKIAAKRQTALF